MGFFSKDKKPSQSLSQIQGVPEGTFRCAVCTHILPLRCLYGAMNSGRLSSIGIAGSAICVICVRWLEFPLSPPPLLGLFPTDENLNKIKLLQDDINLAKQKKYSIADYMPRYRDWLKYRDYMLQQGLIDVVDKLTRCEFVEPSLINRINKGK